VEAAVRNLSLDAGQRLEFRDVHWIKETMAQVDRIMIATEHAKRIGTYGQDDRSKQYPLDNEKKIIDAVNLALTKVRQVEKSKDKEIAELKKRIQHYRIAYTVLVSIITGLAWEGLKALFSFLFR
jgi:hypothetical protein